MNTLAPTAPPSLCYVFLASACLTIVFSQCFQFIPIGAFVCKVVLCLKRSGLIQENNPEVNGLIKDVRSIRRRAETSSELHIL